MLGCDHMMIKFRLDGKDMTEFNYLYYLYDFDASCENIKVLKEHT
jgi:hypothetical protein